MPGPAAVWIAQRVGGAVASAAAKQLFSSAKGIYDNTQAYKDLRDILTAYNKSQPSECQTPKNKNVCSESATLTHNKAAGGTDVLRMYTIVAQNKTILHIQFFDITQKVHIWEYSHEWELVDDYELDPVEALKEIRKAIGGNA